MIIYITTNLLDYKFYIGQDKNERTSYYGSGIYLWNAINKYGKENFRKDILEYCDSIEQLNEREIFWIKLTRAQELGYNIASGGNGFILTGTQKERRSKTLIGHTVSKETREKLRQANLGKKHTKETKFKISKSLIGNTHTLGYKVSKETREKLSKIQSGKGNGFYNKHHSKETREKLRQINLGKTYPDRALPYETKLEIKRIYATGKYKRKEVADMFNTNISMVKRCRLLKEKEIG